MDIVDVIYSYLPAKRKQTPSGWLKFNAVCCHHNGTTTDTRQRAGIIRNAEGCSHLTRKMRDLLGWFGAPDDMISKLSLEALKIEGDLRAVEQITIPHLPEKPLPAGSLKISQWLSVLDQLPDDHQQWFGRVVEYVLSRGLDPTGDFYWTPLNGFADRMIIPFLYQGRTVGHTARKVTDGKPKYISDQTPGFVFNLDGQAEDRKYVIVTEGPMDALSISGVALLGAEIMDKQALFINRLDRAVIVLPDRDRDGLRTVEQAVKLGWSVSLPLWSNDVKDANDAVRKYGVLWTLWSIINSAESSEVKIKLKLKQWIKES